AYLVPGEGLDVDVARSYIAERLPAYMVPSAFVVLEALPLTVNGKLDRRALPAPEYTTGTDRTARGSVGVLEEVMCESFAEVLGLPTVGVHDDFFALGGHSLLVVTLVEKLRSRGVSVAVRDVMGSPTVSGLMNTLSLSSVQDSLGTLFPIRTGGDRPPIFCVHPGGGLSWCYLPLARHLPEEYPLYGLQARGLDGATPLATSVRQMAADYIEQIRSVQPSGPYHLLGFSFGGVPAHEIAVQLQEQGEEVASLILLDAYPPEPSAEEPAGEASAAADAEPGEEGQAGPELWAEIIKAEFGHVLSGFSDDEIAILTRLFQNNLDIRDTHALGRFEGDALLIVATEGKPEGVSNFARWADYVAGEVAEAPVPSAHSNLVAPDTLGLVAEALVAWLKSRGC
ncbi:alpha/beta fold hydrolase, partial [Kitasatospora sp. NPDC098663]|uniref:alpha/beta fold hydrolase n=1 Tax=Kitasatospora sp. NPDC098663 TaxID=3364096 RepID=UPI0037F3EBEF